MGAHPLQTNFTGGELSPFLFSRVDFKKYPNGAETLINAVVKVTGGASRRAGTEFIARAKDKSAFQATAFQNSAFQVDRGLGSTRLVKFVFSPQEAYVLEFGPKYIRFFRNREQIFGTPSGPELITNGDFSSGLTGWTLQQDNGATITDGGGFALLQTNAAGFAQISQELTGLTPGGTYVVTFQSNGLAFGAGATPGAGDQITPRNVPAGNITATFVAPSSGSVVLWWYISSPNDVRTLDTISAHESAALELETPYEADALRSLRFAQSADWMYICHQDYAPRKLIRLSDTLWTIQEVVFSPPPTEEIPIQPLAALTPGATTGQGVTFTTDTTAFVAADVNRQIKSRGGVAVITTVNSGTNVTADIVAPFLSTDPVASGLWQLDGSPFAQLTISAGVPINAIVTLTLSQAGFRSTDVGGFVKALDGMFEITSISSSTVATAKIIQVVPGTLAAVVAGNWTLEFDSWSESQGFPGVVNFFEQRLYFYKGFEMFGSRVGDFENMGLGPNDDDAIRFPIVNGSNQVDVIRWAKSMQDMMVGATGTEWAIHGGNDSTITPNEPPKSQTQSEWGSDPEPDAMRAADALLFIQRGRRQVREMGFSYDKAGASGGYNATDIAILSEHLFRSCAVEMAWCSSPDSYILVVLTDGRMAVATYQRDEEVVAWTQFQMHGWPSTGRVKSVCVIPAKCGTGDEIWILVERDGRQVIEVFDGQLNTESALVYDDTILADTLVGLSHLETKEVDVLYTAQSAFQSSAFQMPAFQRQRTKYFTTIVSGASITLPRESVRIEVGLHYKTTIKTLPLEAQSQEGTLKFRKKRASAIYIEFYCSHGEGITVNGELVPRLLIEATEIFDFYREANLGWDTLQQVEIIQDQPFGMTVLGVSRNALYDDGNS